MADWIGSLRPALDARLYGAGCYTATAGTTSDHYHTFTFDNRFNGIEIITDGNVVLGDFITLTTQYNAGPLGWKRYKKFGKSWFLKKDDRTRIILFPTEPKSGIRLHMEYTSTGADDVKFAVNMFTFAGIEKVNPSALEEGEDW